MSNRPGPFAAWLAARGKSLRGAARAARVHPTSIQRSARGWLSLSTETLRRIARYARSDVRTVRRRLGVEKGEGRRTIQNPKSKIQNPRCAVCLGAACPWRQKGERYERLMAALQASAKDEGRRTKEAA
jgi:hypothetical protein